MPVTAKNNSSGKKIKNSSLHLNSPTVQYVAIYTNICMCMNMVVMAGSFTEIAFLWLVVSVRPIFFGQ